VAAGEGANDAPPRKPGASAQTQRLCANHACAGAWHSRTAGVHHVRAELKVLKESKQRALAMAKLGLRVGPACAQVECCVRGRGRLGPTDAAERICTRRVRS
jgi:hypothetical protein